MLPCATCKDDAQLHRICSQVFSNACLLNRDIVHPRRTAQSPSSLMRLYLKDEALRHQPSIDLSIFTQRAGSPAHDEDCIFPYQHQ